MSSTDPGITGRPARSAWILAVAGAVFGGLVATAGFVQLRPDLMLVEHVEFEGAARAESGGLRHLADVPNGTRIWEVDVEKVEQGIEKHPWVARAQARLEWPDTVVVSIEEHRPVATAMWKGRLVYVDADGVPFVAARSDDLDYPIITGLDEALGEAHPALPRLVLRDALALLGTLEAQSLVGMERVSEVSFDADRGFDVHLVGGAQLAFDLSGFDRQVSRLASLIDRGVDIDEPVLIDLAPAKVAIVRPIAASGGEG